MTSRRSHKKSRNGCVQCKQRRVKCDEANPCVNCARRHLSCTYTLRRTPRPLEYAAVDEDARSAASTPEASPRTGNILDSLPSKIAGGSFLPRDWDAQDFELMHHYCISTALAMSQQERVRNVWAVEIPKIAYSYEFLMHGILSLAAMHLAFVEPEKCSHYQTRSTFHMALGLQTFRKILQSPTEENCCALFSFSSIIMVWICAAPAEPEDTQAIEHTVDLFNLCRGIMALKGFMPIVRNSPLHPLLSPDYAPKSDEILNDIHLHRFAGLDDQIYHLRHQLASEPLNQTDKSVYDQAIYQLERSCRSIERAEAPAQCGMVFLYGRYRFLMALLVLWRDDSRSLSSCWGTIAPICTHFVSFGLSKNAPLPSYTAYRLPFHSNTPICWSGRHGSAHTVYLIGSGVAASVTNNNYGGNVM